MFFHNSVTRREHLEANKRFSSSFKKDPPSTESLTTTTGQQHHQEEEDKTKRMVSYDHKLAHAIIKEWIERYDVYYIICYTMMTMTLNNRRIIPHVSGQG